MRQRLKAASAHQSIAAVSSISNNDAMQLKKSAATGMKKWLKGSKSSVSVAILGFAILMAGVLLLLLRRCAIFKSLDTAAKSLSEEDKTVVFLDWFRASGGNFSNNITIKTFPAMGKGIVALQSVEENDELLFIPRNLIICHDTISREWSSDTKLLKKMKKLEGEQEELLTAFLLLEQAKIETSQWAPYLQLLPSISSRNKVASPLVFVGDEAIEALQDERMIEAANSERQRVKKAHGRFKRLFRSYVDKDALKLSRYVWARFLVNSRAFTIRGDRVLVPFGDVFNGEPDHKTRQYDNGQHFLSFHDLQPEGMTIRADRSTPIGGQLFEDYGDNSNYIYFLHHGFLMRDRGFDCAAIRLPSIVEAPKSREEDKEQIATATATAKARVLSRIRVEDAPLACIKRTGELQDVDVLRIYTMLYNMDAGQAAACNEAKSFSECFPPDLMSAVDTQTRRDEVDILLDAVRQQLKHYPTTIEEDNVILQGQEDVGTEFRHAVIFRSSRKFILREAQAALERQLMQIEEEIKVQNNQPPADSVGEYEIGEEASESDKLARFQQWIARHHFPVNNLELRYISKAMGYGTFAAKPLASGDTYISVPVQAVMNVRSAIRSPWVRQLIREFLEEQSGVSREEVILLLHLLEEKFGPNHLQSHWKPYLDMLPVLDDEDSILGSPLFYEKGEEQLKLLDGTDLLTVITNYRQRAGQTYAALSRQLEQSAHNKTLTWLTERRFRWANAILDSRSIWWSGQRHLVPLLDMVNCQELDPKHMPHHTNLDSTGRHAVTKSSWEFVVGQEVVENYAQPNYIYLLYHGFVLGSNSHDCAHFHLELSALARQRETVALLRELEVFSWTPDVCVSSTDDQAVMRFAKIALLASNPNEAIKLLASKTPSSRVSVPSLAITAGLELVLSRVKLLNELNTDSTTEKVEDFRTRAIRLYRQKQLEHLTALHGALQSQHSIIAA